MAELRRRRPPAETSEPLPSDASDTLSDTDVDCGASSASETDMAERDPSREAGSFGPAGHTSGENKLTKLVKRLFFGTSLLLFLIFVLSLGHLTTLAMLLIAQAPPLAHTAVRSAARRVHGSNAAPSQRRRLLRRRAAAGTAARPPLRRC